MATILLLDDAAAICALYEAELRGDGHEVLISHDPAEAARIARQARPDVIVAEVIPFHDHAPLIDLLCDRRTGRRMFLVVNTGWDVDRPHALSQWADVTVQKSSDLRPLMAAVRQMCARAWFARRRDVRATNAPAEAGRESGRDAEEGRTGGPQGWGSGLHVSGTSRAT
jgi:DNA-binding response OmpR family regulator